MDTETPGREGWGFPVSSKKAHYFIIKPGTVMGNSLCMNWGFYAGPTEQGNDDNPDNCISCRKKLKAIQETNKK